MPKLFWQCDRCGAMQDAGPGPHQAVKYTLRLDKETPAPPNPLAAALNLNLNVAGPQHWWLCADCWKQVARALERIPEAARE